METNKNLPQEQPRPRRQARKTDGKFDNGPEPIAVEQAVTEKTVVQEVTTKVSRPSKASGGKYAPKPKVTQPTFGKVTTTYH